MTVGEKTSVNIDGLRSTVRPIDLTPVLMLHIQACELALSDGQAPIIQNAALGLNPRGLPTSHEAEPILVRALSLHQLCGRYGINRS